MNRYRFWIAAGVLLGAVICIRGSGASGGPVFTKGDFLKPLRLPYRGWQISEIPMSPDAAAILQPRSVVWRRYQSLRGPDAVELAIISGDQKRSIHTPGYCMVSEGWETVSQTRYELVLPGLTAHAVRARMLSSKDGRSLLATYFFTDGEYTTSDLARFQFHQLLRRLQRHVPLGAMVRILVPFDADPARAARLSDDFARQTLPPVLASISSARRGV